MKSLITILIATILSIIPQQANSVAHKKYYLSYGSRVYELKEFKRAIIAGVPKEFRPNLTLVIDDILLYSAKYNVDPILVTSTIWTESSFNPMAKNKSSTASGLMQLVKGTGNWVFKELLKKDGNIDRFNTSHNLEVGIYYMSYLQKEFNNNEKLAVLGYYNGPNKLKKMMKSNINFNHDYYNIIKARFDKINKVVSVRGIDMKSYVAQR